jgi:uncharacterized protein (TIGR02001 family)
MKLKTTPSLMLAALFAACGVAQAQTPAAAPAAAEPDYTFSFNVGAVSEYRYRGITQSRFDPALQGGVDFAHKSGFYLGTWGSTIKWIDDAGGNAGVELDFYGGYKGFSAGPVAFDLGVLRYQYPGHDLAVSPNTTELYVGGTWGPATLKYSHSVTNLFGFANSKNSYYLDLSAVFDLGNGWSLTPHVGYQKVKNNAGFSYTDYSLTVGKDLGKGFSASAAIVGTDSDKTLYVVPGGKHSGKTGLVVGVKYAF